jgi:hypothetical protein
MEGNARETMNGRRSKDEIQEHIQTTQEELRHTIEAIGESLSPGEMVDAVLHALRVGPGEFAASFGRSVRDNPVPLGLVSVGLAWLMLGTDTRRQIRERAEKTGGQVRDRAQKTKTQVRDRAAHMRHKAEGAAEEASGEGREKAEGMRNAAQRGYERARRSASDQPLVLAAVGLFAGAAVAAALPRSRMEQRAFGEQVEHAAETATDAARGVGEGVRGGFEASSEAQGASTRASAGSTGGSEEP